ncbi:hypothetical protein GW17_00008032 [Ensete ventricosum]|nr:hypothetical protein GW17_00008032 [Ensete ventricosum]
MGPAPTPPPTPLRSMASSPVTLPSPHGAGPNSTTYAAALHGFFACNPSVCSALPDVCLNHPESPSRRRCWLSMSTGMRDIERLVHHDATSHGLEYDFGRRRGLMSCPLPRG